mgnify:CR=1 FL=1
MGREGFEPSHLAAYGPEPYVSASSTTCPCRSRDVSANFATRAYILGYASIKKLWRVATRGAFAPAGWSARSRPAHLGAK